jgi:2-oxoisovalerate dehydrogenase E1 component
LYRRIQDAVPEAYYNLPIGIARIAKSGKDLTLITYGMGVVQALELQQEMPEVDMEIIDLRTLLPWDKELVSQSVRKTHRALVLYEGTYTAG